MDKEILKIISYLNILELPNDNLITSDQVNEAYRKLSHIYHPDVANARYKDGKKFVELKDAHDYLIDNIDYVNNLIRNSFSSSAGQSRYSTSDAAYEKWKQEQEFQRRRQEEENRRRQEEERIRKQQEEARRREEARKREEERKRQEELRKEKERQEKIKQKKLYDARKVSILVDVQQFLGSFNKDDYYDAEYKQINDLVGSFIHNVNSDAYSAASDIDNGFTELKEAVNNVKTKKQILRVKRITRWFIAGASFVVVLIIMITLTVNVFVPSAKYNKAVKQMNEGNYDEAIVIFQSLGSYKESEIKIVEANAQIELNNKKKALQKFTPNGLQLDEIIRKIEDIGSTVVFEYELLSDEKVERELNELGYYVGANKKGYSFSDWSISFIEKDISNLKLIIVLTPVFNLVKYNITYEGLDEYKVEFIADEKVYSTQIINPDTHIKMVIPRKIGYIFQGWYEDSSLTSLYDFATPINKDIKLYAKFEQGNNSNYASINTENSASTYRNYTSGMENAPYYTTYLLFVPYTGSYKFNIHSNKSTTKPEESLWGDSRLYGFIYNNPHTMKINGSAYINSIKYCNEEDTEISLFLNYGDVIELTFYTEYAYSKTVKHDYGTAHGNYYNATSCTFNFVLQNSFSSGTVAKQGVNNPREYTIIDEIILREPTKNGYVFDGWYLDKNYKNFVDIIRESVGDLILYAKWIKIEE